MSIRSRVILLFFCMGAVGLVSLLALAGWSWLAAGPVQSVSALEQPISNPVQPTTGSTPLVSKSAQPVPGLAQLISNPTQSITTVIGKSAQPVVDPTRCHFSGRARLHLAPAPPGIGVEAWINGLKVAEGQTSQDGDKTVYTLALDSRYTGQTVIFRYAGYAEFAGESVCEVGQVQTLDLEPMYFGGCGGH